ncbi:MAG: hypothetical protein ABWX67_06395 [Allosphingosinicella sp.]
MTPQEKPLFDRQALHAGAAKAIDTDGQALLAMRVTRPVEVASAPAFESRRESVETITEADLIGEPLLAWSDLAGKVVARYFVQNGHEVALRDDGFRQLRRLVEKILGTRPFSQGVSENFVEEEVFKWWRATLRGETEGPLSAHLLDITASSVRPHRLLVPLSSIEIERAFILGDALVTPIDSAMFERMGAKAAAKFPDSADQIREACKRMRHELGHLTAVGVEIIGELEFARDKAREVAFDMASVLRFMSPAAVSWNITFGCFPHGCDLAPSTTVIEMTDGEISTVSTGMLHSGFFNWKVPFAELDELMKQGFRNCAAFFEKAPLSEFKQRVKKAIDAYSQGVASYDTANRLIYAMSAAEHLLLRDASEPIQTGVGERMAFLIATEAEDRRATVGNFKKAYALRSKQVHHLGGVDDEEVLATFFRNMWVMLFQAMQAMPRFEKHSDFLDAIDRVKFT